MLLLDTPRSNSIKKTFEARNDFGYHFFGFSRKENIEIKGKLEKLKSFVIENEIDEIYCSLKEVSNAQLKEIAFSDEIKKQ
jgi:putative colanic acid biosynthesis UDP-glucose lipid carrier transferase